MSYRIAIAGAGIGGLASAALLAREGHAVTLFERFAAPRPLGSGLVVQPVGLAVLDRIGAGEETRRLSSPIARMLGHEARGRKVLDVSYPAAAPGRGIHRATLFGLLWDRVAGLGLPVVTGAEIAAAPPDGAGRRLALADGRDFGPFDLVVDASGAGSRLSPLRARPLGYGAIWGTVPWPETDFPRDQLRQRYRAASRMAGVLPIGCLPGDPTPRAAVFWSMPLAELDRWPQTPVADWRAQVAALWPQMAPFLETIRDHAQMTPARYSHGTLRRPFAPGLVHIGDAAHRASPQLGQGANMALLDAFALAHALRRPLAEALPDYAAMRRWHVRIYQAMSAAFTPMYQSGSRSLPWLRDLVLAPLSTLPLLRRGLTHLVAGTMIPPLSGTRDP
ncbi:FAD-dependent monooxygenase [Paracoccus versutus]|uniref:2-polyprenyl-6-methoxyphenol hydroxylase-like FAD-dependent oxidoreductase n=1 Tax=Paracoccus versutus TaxID=34007 RepID=A0AAQ0HHB1_PARVE|nr:NAD(P)/FAD-dependent oxidoreductase [Paracoccus versutus]KGJ08231.1 monooxygenase [Paracoccus versutus]REG46914.1 2-polyprenyl-6-methoxyphenol hydroxylase-like FAD-dependent oxidoreductase [Paracoccus versutus]WEJ79138.1 FAD-dependent monooxygenase [Paracoccus versutus]